MKTLGTCRKFVDSKSRGAWLRVGSIPTAGTDNFNSITSITQVSLVPSASAFFYSALQGTLPTAPGLRPNRLEKEGTDRVECIRPEFCFSKISVGFRETRRKSCSCKKRVKRTLNQ